MKTFEELFENRMVPDSAKIDKIDNQYLEPASNDKKARKMAFGDVDVFDGEEFQAITFTSGQDINQDTSLDSHTTSRGNPNMPIVSEDIADVKAVYIEEISSLVEQIAELLDTPEENLSPDVLKFIESSLRGARDCFLASRRNINEEVNIQEVLRHVISGASYLTAPGARLGGIIGTVSGAALGATVGASLGAGYYATKKAGEAAKIVADNISRLRPGHPEYRPKPRKTKRTTSDRSTINARRGKDYRVVNESVKYDHLDGTTTRLSKKDSEDLSKLLATNEKFKKEIRKSKKHLKNVLSFAKDLKEENLIDINEEELNENLLKKGWNKFRSSLVRMTIRSENKASDLYVGDMSIRLSPEESRVISLLLANALSPFRGRTLRDLAIYLNEQPRTKLHPSEEMTLDHFIDKLATGKIVESDQSVIGSAETVLDSTPKSRKKEDETPSRTDN